MAPRLNKRQQRELEELAALEQVQQSSDDEPEPSLSKAAPSGFAALSVSHISGMVDSEEEEDDAGSKPSKKSKKKKKKKSTVPNPAGDASTPQDKPGSVQQTPAPAPTKQIATSQPVSKKADKKAKARQKKAEKEDFESALAELSVKYPDTEHAASSSAHSIAASSLAKLLAVSLPHLNSDAELRKFFGSKVIEANKPTTTHPTTRRGRRIIALQGEQQRSILTSPKPDWARARQQREGLTARALTDEEFNMRCDLRGIGDSLVGSERDVWYSVEYNKRYKRLTRRFLEVVASGDPSAFYQILYHFPWQVDTILQQADIARHREEHSVSAELLCRALFSYELPLQLSPFTFTSGLNRLDFDRVENRPFYLALHRHVIDITRRGLLRTGFEFTRLMYSLDPWDDPHGAAFWLDWLAVKAKMEDWFLEMFDWFDQRISDKGQNKEKHDSEVEPEGLRVNLSVLPGWLYTRALILKMKEDEAEKRGRVVETKLSSTDALEEAITNFPQVVPLLADKADISLSGDIRGRPEFKISTDAGGVSESESIAHLLAHLYVHRAHGIWKDTSIAAWFRTTISSLSSPLPSLPPHKLRYTLFCTIYSPDTLNPNPRYSVYRHVITFLQSSSTQNRALSAFVPITTDPILASSLSCDPVPPPTYTSAYNDEFFKDVNWGSDSRDGGTVDRDTARRAARVLERVLGGAGGMGGGGGGGGGGDGQLEAMLARHPELIDLLEAVGEGDVDLLEVLNDALLQAAQGEGFGGGMAVPDAEEGAMPGGENLFNGLDLGMDFDEGDEGEGEGGDDDDDDDAPEGGQGEAANAATEGEGDIPAPFRMIRNVMGRFWPGGLGAAAANAGESDSEGEGAAHGAGR